MQNELKIGELYVLRRIGLICFYSNMLYLLIIISFSVIVSLNNGVVRAFSIKMRYKLSKFDSIYVARNVLVSFELTVLTGRSYIIYTSVSTVCDYWSVFRSRDGQPVFIQDRSKSFCVYLGLTFSAMRFSVKS